MVATVQDKYHTLVPALNEKLRRRWAACEAMALGRGGISAVARETGLSWNTVKRGIREIQEELPHLAESIERQDQQRIRKPGAGRPRRAVEDPTLVKHLQKLLEPVTRGDPSSHLLWTCKSTRKLAAELTAKGHTVSHMTVARFLAELGYSLQSTRKTREGTSTPDRDAQFQHINRKVRSFQRRGQPVISVDTKKRELVGDFKNGGREWRPRGKPQEVRVHDFRDKDLGVAIPYGVYDLSRNDGWVSVGIDHDTAEFAAATIHRWWRRMGKRAYPRAKELLITADSGDNSQQVMVLRHGDPVPDIDPAPGQDPLTVYIADYVDLATNTISLLENQVIYLFELYTTDMTSKFADFQDMVILLSLGGTEAVATTPCSPIDDIDAVLDTVESTGGVASLESFQTWFNDTLGVNMSQQFKIKLNRQADDTFLFDDTLDPGYVSKGGFYPLDGAGYGNEDNGPHNQFFTFQIDASFTYDASKSQFFTFASTMDVWVFINDQLVIDLGGIHNSIEQEIDMDRLCLTDGDQVNVSLFFAQRNVLAPHFSVSTNVDLIGSARPIAALAFYD